jgi:hypothetical protein
MNAAIILTPEDMKTLVAKVLGVPVSTIEFETFIDLGEPRGPGACGPHVTGYRVSFTSGLPDLLGVAQMLSRKGG